MIAIINYGSGNLASIANIYKHLSIPFTVVDNYREINGAERYILPGVGHFGRTMSIVSNSDIFECLQENVVGKEKPLLGICVGMQLLADSSEEGNCRGLGWIPGNVRKLSAEGSCGRLPHMGWNSVSVSHDEFGLFKGVDELKGFYFLHSYHFEPASRNSVLALTEYGEEIVCAVTNAKNIFGVQFHPEKSHRNGVAIFKNFAEINLC